MEFKEFAKLIDQQFDKLSKKEKLYRIETDRDTLWSLYLSSFPEGTNPIYKERTEHDCNCCKNFIRDVGNVVALNDDGTIETIWDINTEGLSNFDAMGSYLKVTDALATYLRTQKIANIFVHYTSGVGAKVSRQLLPDGSVKNWNHFHAAIPGKFVKTTSIPEILGETKSRMQVFERGLVEITDESITIVEDLIKQNSIYRGQEFKEVVSEFKRVKNGFDKINSVLGKNFYLWKNVGNYCAPIRNTVIGTLLTDLSEGFDLDDAVKSFESKVAPTNYKRPTALITKGMIDQAMKTIEELGIEPSLHRRFARAEDLSVNNVLFTDRATSVVMKDSLKDSLLTSVKVSDKSYSKVEEIGIEEFIQNVIPNISSMEVMFDGRLSNNLMSIVAPVNPDAPNILKWKNNFSWSYNGEITDSIKERVKQAGGNVEGFLRASLSWFNYDDLDIHLYEPGGYELFYGSRGSLSPSGARLDVDMNVSAESREAVENIFWKNKPTKKGVYKVKVHNFNKRETKDVGFVVQFEIDKTIKNFSYKKAVVGYIDVLEFTWDGENVVDIKVGKDIDATGISKEVWGINTEQMQKVNILTVSPNHWDDQTIGNKHYFFILDKCLNPDSTRGLYNEFLDSSFDKHRKVFETIGSKLKCEPSENQLSGLGFSVTRRDYLLCKVSGNFNRMLKILF